MDAATYHRLALSTSVAHDHPHARLVNAILGIAGEVGELTDPFLGYDETMHSPITTLLTNIAVDAQHYEIIKKYYFHGHDLPDNFCESAFNVSKAASLVPFWAGVLRPGDEPPPFNVPQPFDAETRAALANELGDILWYVAQAADALGVSLADVMEANIAKLRRRYPNGFSPEASINREEDARA